MELNNSISILFNLAATGNMLQPKEAPSAEHANERSSFRKISFHGPAPQSRHADNMARRIEKISNTLARFQQSAPALKNASTVFIARVQTETSSFTYSMMQDASGATFTEFTFQVQFKLAGETGFTEAGALPATIADPAIEPAVAAPESVDAAGQTVAPAQTSDERIAELIAYYRIEGAGALGDPDIAAPEGDEEGKGEDASVESHEQNGLVVDISANGVSRLYTGAGDDVAFISADFARRIRTGGGDDALFINADKVSRIRTGGGDDLLNINADNVARIRTGGGDDAVNIEADKVRRLNTGSGDDFLNINADEVARINAGSGDDVLNINADNVTRINTGEGDDVLMVNAETISRINAGEGDDVLNLTADTIGRVNGGAGDDTITLDAEDAAIAFGKGGGEDIININSVGALAIQIDSALAASSDEMTIVEEGDSLILEFASGERLTINNVGDADMISVSIGGENIDLHLSEPPLALDMSA